MNLTLTLGYGDRGRRGATESPQDKAITVYFPFFSMLNLCHQPRFGLDSDNIFLPTPRESNYRLSGSPDAESAKRIKDRRFSTASDATLAPDTLLYKLSFFCGRRSLPIIDRHAEYSLGEKAFPPSLPRRDSRRDERSRTQHV